MQVVKKIERAFNDGVCSIYSTEKRSLVKLLGTFNFSDETLGYKSFFEFKTLGVEVQRVISIPYVNFVMLGHVVKINDITYTVSMIQKKDTFPKTLRLTLSKEPLAWKDVTVND